MCLYSDVDSATQRTYQLAPHGCSRVSSTTIGRVLMLSLAHIAVVTHAHQVTDQLITITSARPKQATQDAFLSNAYMIGATFMPNTPHRFLGVPEVETGEGGEQTT